MKEWQEAELSVEAVCVVGLQDETNTCQLRKSEERLDHTFAESHSAKTRIDEHVCNPGEGRIVGHRATEANLQTVFYSIQAQAQGVFEGTGDYVAWPFSRPIRRPQERLDAIKIESRSICA